MTGFARAARSQPKSAARSTPSASTMSAASARVNVSVLYQFVDTAKRPWLTDVGSAAASLGRAARGSVAPRKMACRAAAGGVSFAVQGHRRALEGQPSRCPFLIGERKWMPRRATLFYLLPSRFFAQELPGLCIKLFSARSFFAFGGVGIFGAAESTGLTAATPKEKAPLSGWRRG